MKNTKGFTLVELLAVITILSILSVISVFSVTNIYDSVKKRTFLTEVKELVNTNKATFITRSIDNTNQDHVSSYDDTKLPLTREELNYYLEIDKNGDIHSFYVDNNSFYVRGTSMSDLTTEDIMICDNCSYYDTPDTPDNPGAPSNNSWVVNGTNIGDEICFENECFNVFKNDGTSLMLLSKYNLYVEDKIITIAIFNGKEDAINAGYTRSNGGVCVNKYSLYENRIVYICIKKESLSYETVLQNSSAIGSRIDASNNAILPEIGVVSVGGENHYLDDDIENAFNNEPYEGEYLDFDIANTESNIYRYLDAYKNFLIGKGVSISNISILSLSEINDFVQRVSDNTLPLNEWYNSDGDMNETKLTWIYGNIKDYIPNEHAWLFNTTYWCRTISSDASYNFFVDSTGNLLTDENYISLAGAGIRPIITVPISLFQDR